MTNVLSSNLYTCRVSSTLNRNAKEYGKKFMFDGHEDTCWNSDQGVPQWIDFEFSTPEVPTIKQILIQFQGGFVGQDCFLETGDPLVLVEHFYPEDINSPQTFTLSKPINAKHLRLVFPKSSDFFGRIIIYNLELS